MSTLVEFHTLHEDYDGCFHRKSKVTIDFAKVSSVEEHWSGAVELMVGKHHYLIDAKYKECVKLMKVARR